MGKRAAEAALSARASSRSLPTLSLRLPVIQGEADGHASRRLWAWLERMRDGGPVLLPDGGVQRVRFLYAADAARALVALAGIERWPDEPALNLAQPDEPTLREFLEQVAADAGLASRFVPVSTAELERAGLAETCAPYWGRWCSRPDPSRALLLGFAPAVWPSGSLGGARSPGRGSAGVAPGLRAPRSRAGAGGEAVVELSG
jgi:nucleoside-diphosphate-sugar epimerase